MMFQMISHSSHVEMFLLTFDKIRNQFILNLGTGYSFLICFVHCVCLQKKGWDSRPA